MIDIEDSRARDWSDRLTRVGFRSARESSATDACRTMKQADITLLYLNEEAADARKVGETLQIPSSDRIEEPSSVLSECGEGKIMILASRSSNSAFGIPEGLKSTLQQGRKGTEKLGHEVEKHLPQPPQLPQD